MSAAHPYLEELLSGIQWTNCTADEFGTTMLPAALAALEGANESHMNASEKINYAAELIKLQEIAHSPSPDGFGVAQTALSRLVGASPARFDRRASKFTYAHSMTPLCENLSITETVRKLKGTKLGGMMYGEQRKRSFKPKYILSALRSIEDLSSVCSEVGPILGRVARKGAEVETILFPHLNAKTTMQHIQLGWETLCTRATEADTRSEGGSLFVVSNMTADACGRRALYASV